MIWISDVTEVCEVDLAFTESARRVPTNCCDDGSFEIMFDASGCAPVWGARVSCPVCDWPARPLGGAHDRFSRFDQSSATSRSVRNLWTWISH